MREPLERSSLAVGLDWAARITSIGLEFALPALIGAGIDRWLGSRPAATLGGAALGFCVGMVHLLRIASESSQNKNKPKRDRPRG